MNVTVPDSVPTIVIPANPIAGSAVWFQNFDTVNFFALQPMSSDLNQTLDADGFLLPPAKSSTEPSILVIADKPTLTRAPWQAYQNSGGPLSTLFCGRW